jgi:hypothetical protein
MVVILAARRLSQALSIDGPPKTLGGPRRGLGIALHGPDDLADFLTGRGGGVGGACDIVASAREGRFFCWVYGRSRWRIWMPIGFIDHSRWRLINAPHFVDYWSD